LNYYISFNEKLSFIFIFLVLFIWLLVLFSYKKTLIFYFKNYLSWIFLLIIRVLLFFIIKNILFFFIFFELSLIPIIIIILGWGYQVERIQARIYLIMYTIFFSLPFFIVLINFIFNNNNFIFNNNNFIFNNFLCLLIILIFLVKFPVYFLHLWLPKAHVEAPARGSIILAAILLKIGSYGLIRILSLFFLKKTILNCFIFFGIIGSLLRVIVCLFQIDQKSLIAYSSVNHITIIFLSLIIFLNLSIKGCIIIMFTHGLVSRALFNFSNIIYERFQTRNMFFIQGLLILYPSITLFLSLRLIINFRVPPFLRVFSEVIIFITYINWRIQWLVILTLLVFFSCYYSINLYNIRSHGKINSYFSFLLTSIRELKNICFYILFILLILFNINFLYSNFSIN